MTTDSETQDVITEKQQRFASWMADVLIYIVVLNLFVEFSEAIDIDSFWISILTALLLKGLLDAVVGLEHRVGAFFDRRDGTLPKMLGVASQFLILFTSKFIILEVVNLIFGDRVQLGHFVDVLVLIIAMMVTREVFERIYTSLGEPSSES